MVEPLNLQISTTLGTWPSTSTTLGDLTTPDLLTFSLTAATDVLVEYMASGATFANPLNLQDTLLIDGVSSATTLRTNTSGHWAYNILPYKAHLNAGPHTIRVQHRNTGSGSDNSWWNNRLIHVTAVD